MNLDDLIRLHVRRDAIEKLRVARFWDLRTFAGRGFGAYAYLFLPDDLRDRVAARLAPLRDAHIERTAPAREFYDRAWADMVAPIQARIDEAWIARKRALAQAWEDRASGGYEAAARTIYAQCEARLEPLVKKRRAAEAPLDDAYRKAAAWDCARFAREADAAFLDELKDTDKEEAPHADPPAD